MKPCMDELRFAMISVSVMKEGSTPRAVVTAETVLQLLDWIGCLNVITSLFTLFAAFSAACIH